MNPATTWLAERAASLLPQASNAAAGCNCSYFYWSSCSHGSRFHCNECYPCRGVDCSYAGRC